MFEYVKIIISFIILFPLYVDAFSRLLSREELELKHRIEIMESRGYEPVPIYKLIRTKNQNSPVLFSALDGSCGVWNSTIKHYQEPEYAYDDINNNCMAEMQEFIQKPACGWQMYSQMKYCAKLQMYDQGYVDSSPFVRGEDKGKIIIIIDGCVKCAAAEERALNKTKGLKQVVSVTFTLEYKFESAVFMKCPQLAFAEKITHQLMFNTTLDEGGSDNDGFAFYGKLSSCPGMHKEMKSQMDLPKIQMKVEHDCTPDGGLQTITTVFPGLVSDQFQGFLAEMRGVLVDLDERKIVAVYKDGEIGGDWEWDNKGATVLPDQKPILHMN